ISSQGQGPLFWSADGRYVVEEGYPPGGTLLMPRSPDTGAPRVLADCSNASWSPRGATLAVECRGWLTLVDPRTGRRIDVAQAHRTLGPGPVWAPDGTAVATTDDSSVILAWPHGRVTRVEVGGCWAGGVLGFTRDGRAVVEASVQPQGD